MLNFGLIGCGTHARWAVLPAITKTPCCRLIAAADVLEDALEAVEEKSVARYTDYRAMLANERLDAVYVATPCEAHAEATIAALQAGCHVVCEKPMGMNAGECRQMNAAARTAGKQLIIDFESRYIPAYQQIRAWIAAGRLGTVRAVHIDHFWDGHKSFGALAERRKRLSQASGCLDCGIHQLDLTRFFLGGGEWQEIHALGEWFGEELNYPPHIAILARLSPGIIVTLNASFAYTAYITQQTSYHGLAIVGDRGVIALAPDAEGKATFKLVSETATESCGLVDADHAEVIPRVLTELDAVVNDGRPLPPFLATGEDGLMAQIIVDEANRQAVERRTIRS